jgi:8-oxo-dGTP diphosphatase
VLLGLRKGAHGEGDWGLPGGRMEFGHTIFQTARCEVKEETDLDISDMEIVSLYDELDFLEQGIHYINIGVIARSYTGEVRRVEPEKCLEWKWFGLNELPDNLFAPTRICLENYKNKVLYYESKA